MSQQNLFSNVANPNQKRITELEKIIKKAKVAYYIDSKPIMSDDDFDLLRDELKILDPNNRILALTGTDVKDKKGWASKKLSEPMGSLEKVNSMKEFNDWAEQHKGKKMVYNPKGDGGSIELTYLKGKLVSAITRGDGYEGFDILSNVLKMKNVKPTIKTTADVVILQGEILIYYTDFLALKKLVNDPEKYKNPRNTANGLAKSQSNSDYCKFLTILYWGASIRGNKVLPDDFEGVCKHYGVKSIGTYQIKHLQEYYDKLGKDPDKREEIMRKIYNFDIDGFVVKCNEPPQMRGNTPVNYIAVKFPAPAAVTKISEILLDKGKSGQITPVAKFDPPVNLMGATITKASIGSWSLMQQKGLFPGAIVKVIRANDVIPKIEEVVTPATVKFTLADAQKIMGDTNVVVRGAHLFTTTRDTQTVIYEIVNMFKILEIQNVAESTIEAIVNHFNIKHAYEIFDVDFDKMKTVAGFGDSKIDNLKLQIQAKSRVSFKIFMDCLNVNNMGTSRIVEIVNTFGLKNVNDLYKLKEQDFLKVNAFSDVLAKSVYDGLQAKKDFAYQLVNRLIIDDDIGKPVSNKLGGKKFCITGRTSMKRSDMEKLIEANGGKNSSIGSCDYLINNDSDSTSSKNKKAAEKGIPVISEKQFFKTFGL
jgi:DNA ligase (NAD+)